MQENMQGTEASEFVRRTAIGLLEGAQSIDAEALARKLFLEDGELTARILESAPRLVEAAAESVRFFAEALAAMEEEKRSSLLKRAFTGVDGSKVAEAVNSVSRLIIGLHEDEPRLITEARLHVVDETLRNLDFGKLRKALTYLAENEFQRMRGELEILAENPVALINLFSVVAPALNEALRLLDAVFKALDLPAEAMTYALLKIIDDVDWQGFAAVLNGASKLLVTLHRGNLILGEGDPYSGRNFYSAASDLLEGLDARLAAEALAALAEEGSVLIRSLVERLLEDEEAATAFTEAIASFAGSAFRLAADTMELLEGMPAGYLENAASSFAEQAEPREAGRLLRLLVLLARKLHDKRPDIARGFLAGVLSTPSVKDAETRSPAFLGSTLERVLRAYNLRYEENPERSSMFLKEILDHVDERELSKALRRSTAALAEALEERPGLAAEILRAVFTLLYRAARGRLAVIRGRLERRRG